MIGSFFGMVVHQVGKHSSRLKRKLMLERLADFVPDGLIAPQNRSPKTQNDANYFAHFKFVERIAFRLWQRRRKSHTTLTLNRRLPDKRPLHISSSPPQRGVDA